MDSSSPCPCPICHGSGLRTEGVENQELPESCRLCHRTGLVWEPDMIQATTDYTEEELSAMGV